MSSRKIGRRKFIKGASSAVIGLATAPFWNPNLTFAETEKQATPQYRALGKTGLKVTAVSMGVMNCTDPAVLRRAFGSWHQFFRYCTRLHGRQERRNGGQGISGKARQSGHTD